MKGDSSSPSKISAARSAMTIGAQLLADGGPRLWEAFMKELRAVHLGAPAPRRSVLAELQAAYEKVVAAKKRSTAR